MPLTVTVPLVVPKLGCRKLSITISGVWSGNGYVFVNSQIIQCWEPLQWSTGQCTIPSSDHPLYISASFLPSVLFSAMGGPCPYIYSLWWVGHVHPQLWVGNCLVFCSVHVARALAPRIQSWSLEKWASPVSHSVVHHGLSWKRVGNKISVC